MSEQQDTQQQPAAAEDSQAKTERQSSQQSERGGRDRSSGGGGRGNRRRHSQSARPLEQSLNMEELRELVELINEYGFTDFELENKDVRVRLRRELAPQLVAASAPAVAQPTTSAIPQTNQSAPGAAQQTATSATTTAGGGAAAPAEKAAGEDEDLLMIPSPIVGTFYRSPSPTAEPFVRLGSQVTPDTIVCIIEAMKLMNEILAETTGEVAKIYVENGQPVEYGQPLFGIKK